MRMKDVKIVENKRIILLIHKIDLFDISMQKHTCVPEGGRSVTRYSAVTDYIFRIRAVFNASELNLQRCLVFSPGRSELIW